MQAAFRRILGVFAGLYNRPIVKCPLCQRGKARRQCPALGREICAVCCGTKRQIEIACPSDCPYLASAREHPPAAALRREQDDLAAVGRLTRDLNERQSKLCFFILMFLNRYEPPDLHPLLDDDIASAASALAGTAETAARGVIYEHRPATASASRLAGALNGVLAEARASGGTPFERDAAIVLRRVEAEARAGVSIRADGRTFVDWIRRILGRTADEDSRQAPATEAPRLIMP
jgi:hypothetical protein